MILHPQRMSTLKKPESIYVITCTGDLCSCKIIGECYRGFYSLFIQAMQGIYFSEKMNMPYYVNFGDKAYCYSDKQMSDANFWNYYFIQPQTKPDATVSVLNFPQEVYPIRIWAKSYFKEIYNEVIHKLVWQPEVHSYLQSQTEFFKKYKVLGVHIRKTDHSNEIVPVGLEYYFKKIDRQVKHYDKLFVATDDRQVIQLCQTRYPEKLFYLQVQRSEGPNAIHGNSSFDNHYQLGLDALLDSYSLSLCKKSILSPSNLSYAACLFNPQLKYELMESGQARKQRLKTLLVYYLDRWNVRKW